MNREAVEGLLDRLLALDGAERDRLLHTVTDGDPPLRAAFEALLAEAGSEPGALDTGGVLDSPLGRRVLEGLSGHKVSVGDTIGSVTLVEELGEGGMGRVFRGFDAKLERPVAVKTVHGEHRLDPATTARFRREATILSRLNHPGICQVYDLVERPEADYLLLEYVDGATLGDHLRSAPALGERLRLARGLADALAAAHGRGIVHRDLKPDNVMVTPDGVVKVLDFGIARLVDADPEPSGAAEPRPGDAPPSPSGSSDQGRATFRTEHGLVIGTVAYMSPEQAAGDPVTEASDLFSLGLLLQELFTGRPAYPRLPHGELLQRVLLAETLPVEGLDADLARLIRDLLSLHPADRPSATATAARLARVADKPLRRRRALLAAATLLTVAGSAALAVSLLRRDPADLCRDAGAPMERVWNRSTAESLRLAFARDGVLDGPSTGERVASRLDDYATRWGAMREDACAATHLRGEQSTELLDRRIACLDRALAAVRALLALLEGGDPAVLGRAMDAAEALPALSLCADRELLLAPVAPPSEPSTRAALAALDEELAAGFAAMDAGQVAAAEEVAARADAAARSLGYRPAEARAHYLLGRLERMAGRFAEARGLLEEALTSALAGGDEEWTVRALAELVFVTGSDLADLEAARRWQTLGEAMLERVDDDNAVAADLYHAAGTVRMWDDPEASRALLERALRIRLELGDSAVEVLRSRVNLAMLHYLTGDFASSERWALEAAAQAERDLGKRHPYTATALGNVGSARLLSGDPAGAREAFERARAIHAATKGEGSFDVAVADVNLALADLDQGNHRDALGKATRAQAVFTASLPTDHPYLAYPEYVLGRALTGLGRPGDAVGHLERALALRGGDQSLLPTELPEAQLALARALWNAGRQRRRAVALARAAEASLADVPWATRLRAEVRRWLAELPGQS